MAAEEEKVEVVKKGLTIKSLSVGVILVVFWTLFCGVIWTFDSGWCPHFWQPWLTFLTMFLMWIFLAATSKVFTMSRQELIVVYSMVLSTSAWMLVGPPRAWLNTLVGLVVHHKTELKLFSPLWIPLDMKVLSGYAEGGTSVPWDAWVVPLLFIFTFMVLFNLFMLFFSCILRRQWVEVEGLPFPYVQPILEMTEDKDRATPSSLKSRKFGLVLLGFLIGFLTGGFGGIETYEPYPALFSVINPQIKPVTYLFDYTHYVWNIFPATIGIASVIPTTVATMYMCPLPILYSAFLFWIILYFIWAPTAYRMGIIPSGEDWWAWTRFATFRWFPGVDDGVQPWALAFGCLIGVGLWPLILRWRDFVSTLKKQPRELEEREPIPYRLAWILTIASLIALIAMTMATGVSLIPALAIWITMFLYFLGNVRVMAESPGEGGDPITFITAGGGLNHLIWLGFYQGKEGTIDAFNAMFVSEMGWENFGVYYNSGILSLQAFHAAHITKTRSRDVFIAVIISVIIAAAVGLPFTLWLNYTFSMMRNYYSFLCWAGLFPGNEIYAYGVQGEPGAGIGFQWGLPLGFILAGVLYILRLRYPFIPHPVGLPLAITKACWQQTWGWWVGMLLKWLTLKIGGVKLYHDTGLPIAIGILVGGVSTMVIRGIYATLTGIAPVFT